MTSFDSTRMLLPVLQTLGKGQFQGAAGSWLPRYSQKTLHARLVATDAKIRGHGVFHHLCCTIRGRHRREADEGERKEG